MIETFTAVVLYLLGSVVWFIITFFCVGNMIGGHNGWYQLGGLIGTILMLALGITFIIGV